MSDQWKKQRGISLVEVLISLGIFVLLTTAFVFTRFDKADEGEKFLRLLASRLQERRANAMRLSANKEESSSVLRLAAPPIEINFTDWQTTAELKVEGSGAVTQLLVPPSGTNYWQYVYQGEPLERPQAWRLVTDTKTLAVPPLEGFVPDSVIAFSADGRLPSVSTLPNGASAIKGLYLTDGSSCFAVGVHQSGLVEVFRYDVEQQIWKGYGNRDVTGDPTVK